MEEHCGWNDDDDDMDELDLPLFKPKITLLGDRTVGKTTMLSPYLIDPLDKNAIKTFGFKVAKRMEMGIRLPSEDMVDCYLMLFEVDGEQIGDLTRERLDLAMGGSNGVMIMADSLHVETMESIFYQLDKFFEINKEDRPIIIAANKVDVLNIIKARIKGTSVSDQIRDELRDALNPNIRTEMAVKKYMKDLRGSIDTLEPEDLLFKKGLNQLSEEVSKRFGPAPYIYMSALTGKNVNKVFKKMAQITLPESLN